MHERHMIGDGYNLCSKEQKDKYSKGRKLSEPNYVSNKRDEDYNTYEQLRQMYRSSKN